MSAYLYPIDFYDNFQSYLVKTEGHKMAVFHIADHHGSRVTT